MYIYICIYMCVCICTYIYSGQEQVSQRDVRAAPPESSLQTISSRRIYRRGFTDFTREGIFTLGSLPLWGNSKFYLRIKSLPWVSPKPPFGLILDSTVQELLEACASMQQVPGPFSPSPCSRSSRALVPMTVVLCVCLGVSTVNSTSALPHPAPPRFTPLTHTNCKYCRSVTVSAPLSPSPAPTFPEYDNLNTNTRERAINSFLCRIPI